MERFFVVGEGLRSMAWEDAYDDDRVVKTSLAIQRDRSRAAMAYAAGYFFGVL